RRMPDGNGPSVSWDEIARRPRVLCLAWLIAPRVPRQLAPFPPNVATCTALRARPGCLHAGSTCLLAVFGQRRARRTGPTVLRVPRTSRLALRLSPHR